MKHNLSTIMTRAHRIRKETNCTMSIALRKSWLESKLELDKHEFELERLNCRRFQDRYYENEYWDKYHKVDTMRKQVREIGIAA